MCCHSFALLGAFARPESVSRYLMTGFALKTNGGPTSVAADRCPAALRHRREGGGDGILNHTLIGRIVYEVRVDGEPAEEALICQRAPEAVRAVQAGRVKPYRAPLPVTFEVDFKRTAPARMATLFPGVERRGPRTIAITDSDYVRAFKLFWGCLIVGMASAEGLL